MASPDVSAAYAPEVTRRLSIVPRRSVQPTRRSSQRTTAPNPARQSAGCPRLARSGSWALSPLAARTHRRSVSGVPGRLQRLEQESRSNSTTKRVPHAIIWWQPDLVDGPGRRRAGVPRQNKPDMRTLVSRTTLTDAGAPSGPRSGHGPSSTLQHAPDAVRWRRSRRTRP